MDVLGQHTEDCLHGVDCKEQDVRVQAFDEYSSTTVAAAL
jgi:hypothetical protein